MTLFKKSLLSLLDTLFFFVISNPFTYKYVNKIFGNLKKDLIWNESTQCPKTYGYFIHVLVYFVINFASMYIMKIMKLNDLSLLLMFKFSLIGTLLYISLSNTDTYKLTNNILNKVMDSDKNIMNGCPNINGLILHSGLFFIILLVMMFLPD
jgi:hypothetical protein